MDPRKPKPPAYPDGAPSDEPSSVSIDGVDISDAPKRGPQDQQHFVENEGLNVGQRQDGRSGSVDAEDLSETSAAAQRGRIA